VRLNVNPSDTRPWRFFIGRSRRSDIVLTDPTVSRVHAVVCREEGRWTIADLDSVNGVRVNGKRVEKAFLTRGDLIMLGRVCLGFGERPDAPVEGPLQIRAAAALPDRTASRASA
jgi:pSer/pThr/pTyr-binding forkhead associated (FHA) protein